MLTLERIYLDRDNSIDVILMADGVAADLASVTRMTLAFGTTVIDSDDAESSAVFDWLEGGGKVVISLGDQEIAAGEYAARLVVYDPSHTSGLVWGDIDVLVDQG